MILLCHGIFRVKFSKEKHSAKSLTLPPTQVRSSLANKPQQKFFNWWGGFFQGRPGFNFHFRLKGVFQHFPSLRVRFWWVVITTQLILQWKYDSEKLSEATEQGPVHTTPKKFENAALQTGAFWKRWRHDEWMEEFEVFFINIYYYYDDDDDDDDDNQRLPCLSLWPVMAAFKTLF